MPRGKYVNHKGRSRQFTPSDQLQQELGMLLDKDQLQDLDEGKGEPLKKLEHPEHDDDYTPAKNSARGVHNLIQVSNPNRLPREVVPLGKPMVSPEKDKYRGERKQKQEPRSCQAQADLERLSIVRKEREAAAQRRLAAKKAAAEADASRLVSSLRKMPKQSTVEEVNPTKGLALRGK